MQIALLVFPDFLLLALGVVLRHRLHYQAGFFVELERLIYYVLFPALLFQSILARPIALASALGLVQAMLALMLGAAALAWLARWVLRPDPVRFASAFQCGFRFNTYLGLALASSLGGPQGIAVMALIIGFAVPVANLLAVLALAPHGGEGLWRALVRNPLLISTVVAVTCNVGGLQLPATIDTFLSRLGSAALALGIICVGASLTLQATQASGRLVSWMISVKLLAMPLIALLVGAIPALALTPVERQMLLLFASLPTASSAYVLAARMGGDARLVALIISLATLASIISIPVWQGLFG